MSTSFSINTKRFTMGKIKITWINENPGASADERGFWSSVEGRFYIAPLYRGTVNPAVYYVVDEKTKKSKKFDLIRDCKEWATTIVIAEWQQRVNHG